MITLLTLTLAAGLIFWFGYYLGNQIGRTEHIRHHLAALREQRRGQGTTPR